MRKFNVNLAAALIGLTIVGLLLANLAIARMTIDISPDISVSAASRNKGSQLSLASTASTTQPELSETLARPIFSPTRREFVPRPALENSTPTVVSMPPPAIRKPALILQGTRQIGGRTMALIKLELSPDADWYSAGQAIDVWKVSLIDANRLVLSYGEERAEYTLYTGDALGQQ